ncbi:hypothetical protein COP2_023872 [Malus domestica]
MRLCFLSVSPLPPRLIACHVSPVAVHPWPSASAAPPQVPAALPSLSLSASSTPPPPLLTCAIHCPHFESYSVCTHESNLHRPVIVDVATEFFKTVGVSDFTFDSCKIAHHPKRYEDCKDLLSSKAWHLEKALGYNFSPGTPSRVQEGPGKPEEKKRTGIKKKKRL